MKRERATAVEFYLKPEVSLEAGVANPIPFEARYNSKITCFIHLLRWVLSRTENPAGIWMGPMKTVSQVENLSHPRHSLVVSEEP